MARREVDGHAGQAIAADPSLARACIAVRNGTFSPDDHDGTRASRTICRGRIISSCRRISPTTGARQREVDAAFPRSGALDADGGAEHGAVGLVLVGPDDSWLYVRYLGRKAARAAGGAIAALRAVHERDTSTGLIYADEVEPTPVATSLAGCAAQLDGDARRSLCRSWTA